MKAWTSLRYPFMTVAGVCFLLLASLRESGSCLYVQAASRLPSPRKHEMLRWAQRVDLPENSRTRARPLRARP